MDLMSLSYIKISNFHHILIQYNVLRNLQTWSLFCPSVQSKFTIKRSFKEKFANIPIPCITSVLVPGTNALNKVCLLLNHSKVNSVLLRIFMRQTLTLFLPAVVT